MKKIVLILIALFLSASYGYAQTADVAVVSGIATDAKVAAEAKTADAKESINKDRRLRNAKIREINKQISEAKKAGKPYKDLLQKRKEIMMHGRIESK
ncbi:MAG: hypothetical protein IJ532_00415 [Alphaproteobacteria bacterium]|nr:hypothetical protein [Alphaproteobacteria bacterium]